MVNFREKVLSNLRENVTRGVKYSVVIMTHPNGVEDKEIVYGHTTVKKELNKFFKEFPNATIMPKIEVEHFEEKRTMTIQDFLNNSIVIDNIELINIESEEN